MTTTLRKRLRTIGNTKIPIFFKVTNNGSENLNKVTPRDQTIEGDVKVENITWTFNGKPLKVASGGALETADGKALTLKPGEVILGKENFLNCQMVNFMETKHGNSYW